MAEVKKEEKDTTTLVLNKDDAALIIGIDGEFQLVIPEVKDEGQTVPGNALVVAALGTLICKQGQPFIDEIIERFEALQDDELKGATMN